MSGRPRPPATEARADGAPDDQYAQAYSEGYGEGLRDALRDLLQHASRGHTAQELRILIESRLARIRDEVELKRRSVLSPPRRPSWGAILRPPSATTPPPVAPSPEISVGPGEALLVLEPRPGAAVAVATASASRFSRLLVVSFHAPAFSAVTGDRLRVVSVRSGGADAGVLGPSELAGRVREVMEGAGGALVYLDAFEILASDAGFEPMLKFITWLNSAAPASGSAVIVSLDPGTLEPRSLSLLQRTFTSVRNG